MALQFGEYPFNVYVGPDDLYAVVPEHQGNADECGVNYTFPVERLEIMRARGLAYGYDLQIVDAPEPPAPVQPTPKRTGGINL